MLSVDTLGDVYDTLGGKKRDKSVHMRPGSLLLAATLRLQRAKLSGGPNVSPTPQSGCEDGVLYDTSCIVVQTYRVGQHRLVGYWWADGCKAVGGQHVWHRRDPHAVGDVQVAIARLVRVHNLC